MKIEFTQEDFQKLDEIIQNLPFKYAYPLFTFFQGKITETQKAEDAKKQPAIQTIEVEK